MYSAYTLVGDYGFMDKLEEFKEFVKDKPFLRERVNNNETTWQSLYETYDLFGKDADVFKANKEEKSTDNSRKSGTSNILKMLEGVNLDKINENLEGMKKILGVLGEFAKKENTGVNNRRNTSKAPRRYDD